MGVAPPLVAEGEMIQQRLRIIPLDLATANRAVAAWHRHHRPVQMHKWSLAVEDESGTMRGVAIAMRPNAIPLDDGLTIEVVRMATDGTSNACSCLYGAMKRTAREMGYERIITYTLSTEPGTSLKASGWVLVEGRDLRSPVWHPNLSRVRAEPDHLLMTKQRWDCWLVPADKRRPRVKSVFGQSFEGTLLEGM